MLFPTDLAHQQIRTWSMEKDFQRHFLWSQPDYQSIKSWTLTLIKIWFSTRLWVALRSTLERGFRVSIFKIGFSPSEKFFRIGLLWWNLPRRPKISHTWQYDGQKRWDQNFLRIWCFEQYFWWKYKGTKVQIARGIQENTKLASWFYSLRIVVKKLLGYLWSTNICMLKRIMIAGKRTFLHLWWKKNRSFTGRFNLIVIFILLKMIILPNKSKNTKKISGTFLQT